MKSTLRCLCLGILIATTAGAADAKPKYGPLATVLSQSHAYFMKNPSPDFWSLIPYYVSQQDEGACSVATVAMVVNAARVGKKLTADDELVTQPAVLQKVKAAAWHRIPFRGVTLDELGPIVEEALRAYGVETASVTVVHADASPAARAKLVAALSENEKSARDFILLNFNQAVYTGDAEVGHIAPLGAYDAKNGRALVFDPDRKWYEPYWVSVDTLLAGMATVDQSVGKTRGYVWVKLK